MLSDNAQRRLNDLASLLLRLILGVVFMFHGSQKLFATFGGGGISGTTQAMEGMGIPFPAASAIVVGCTEFFGGLLLFIGLGVRLAVLPMIFAMCVAVFHVHRGAFSSQHNGMEFPLTLAVALAALGLMGPGRVSLSTLLGSRKTSAAPSPNRPG